MVVERARLSSIVPSVFLDLATPPDIDPSVGTLPSVTLITLETIGEKASGDCNERSAVIAAGRSIVSAQVEKTASWLREIA